jgi:hypothetical protein
LTSGENSIGRGWAAALVLAALLCLAALAPAAALAGSISGTVTDAVTTEPIEGLEVCAYPLEEGEPVEEEIWFCEDTDSLGDYTIEDLEAGEYGVEFWGRPLNYVPQYFDGQETWWEWNPVLVGSGAVVDVDAAMVEGGGIEGTVEEAGSGMPVEAAWVCAWTIAGGQFGGCAETESNGEYLLGGMAEGEYEVEFWAEEQDLLTQYYDHKDTWWEANPVTVTLGSVATAIDADLLAAARVEGQVRRASNGSPLAEVEVCAWSTDPEGAFRCGWSGDDGRYAIHGLPVDQYKVEFWPYDESLPVQFWDHKATWEEANPLFLGAGSVTAGIDADLGTPPPAAPPAVTPPVVTPPVAQAPKRKRCKKGFRKKRVHGKVRCVKKKRKHRHKHVHGRPPVTDRIAFRRGH